MAVPCLLLLGTLCPGIARADLGDKITKLKPKVYCVTAGFDAAWDTTLEVLKENHLAVTLEDKRHGIITTAFIDAKASELRKLSSSNAFFRSGNFTLKMILEEVTGSFTKLHITLQIRQKKVIGKGERLLKSQGTFEKFLAHRINQLAIAKQFPAIYELRLGFDLVPDLKNERFRIKNVQKRSPAGEAGFNDGDWLLSIDNKQISLRGELFESLLKDSREIMVTFKVMRRETVLDIPLWILRIRESKDLIGLHLNWDQDSREFWVKRVVPGSRADRAGLQANDIILYDNRIPLNSWTNYYRALAHDQMRHRVQLEIERNGQVLKVAL